MLHLHIFAPRNRLILNTFVYNGEKFPMMDGGAGIGIECGGNRLRIAGIGGWQARAPVLSFRLPRTREGAGGAG